MVPFYTETTSTRLLPDAGYLNYRNRIENQILNLKTLSQEWDGWMDDLKS